MANRPADAPSATSGFGNAPAPAASGRDELAASGADVVLVKSGFRQLAVRVAEIAYTESARNYVRLYLQQGTVIKARVPISRLAEHLGDHRFLRIHRGRLVNKEQIRAVSSIGGGRLALALGNGATIIVARDRRRAVLEDLGASSPTSDLVRRPLRRR